MTRRLKYPEAATELGVEETWLRRHIKRLPHSKIGRVVYFTDADMERIDHLFHHEPTAGPLATASATAKPDGSQPARLVPLPSRRSVRG